MSSPSPGRYILKEVLKESSASPTTVVITQVTKAGDSTTLDLSLNQVPHLLALTIIQIKSTMLESLGARLTDSGTSLTDPVSVFGLAGIATPITPKDHSHTVLKVQIVSFGLMGVN
jgi:hypothetical protein